MSAVVHITDETMTMKTGGVGDRRVLPNVRFREHAAADGNAAWITTAKANIGEENRYVSQAHSVAALTAQYVASSIEPAD